MNKVRVNHPEAGNWDGYVIASMFREGQWIYKVSLTESKTETFDNWVPEDWMEKTI
jgi:hypothetical protein